jgi:hypothetical protein
MRDVPGYEPARLPFQLAFEQWTRPQARAYFEWFIGHLEPRIQALRRSIRESEVGCELDIRPGSLLCAGEFLALHARPRLLTSVEHTDIRTQIASAGVPEGSVDAIMNLGDWTLDDTSLYLCLDVGIYLGEVVRSSAPDRIRWQLHPSRSSRVIGFNRPVLGPFRGDFKSRAYLDPIHVVEVVCLKLVESKASPSELKEVFDYWHERVPGPSDNPSSRT